MLWDRGTYEAEDGGGVESLDADTRRAISRSSCTASG
jgi:hypothetical protein